MSTLAQSMAHCVGVLYGVSVSHTSSTSFSISHESNTSLRNLEIIPEFALLSIHIKLKLGTLDTVRVRDTIDVLDLASSRESRR